MMVYPAAVGFGCSSAGCTPCTAVVVDVVVVRQGPREPGRMMGRGPGPRGAGPTADRRRGHRRHPENIRTRSRGLRGRRASGLRSENRRRTWLAPAGCRRCSGVVGHCEQRREAGNTRNTTAEAVGKSPSG